jgi:heptosyltransferase-2
MITVTNPPRFLIVQTAFIGDVILATALLEELHERLPNARVDMLVRRGNESLLANHPLLNEVLVWDKKGKGGLLGKYGTLLDLLKLVRERHYDVILNLQRFGTTGLLTALANARISIGFAKNPFSRWFTYAVDHRIEPGVHEVDRNAGLLEPLELPNWRSRRTRPRLYPSADDYAAVKAYQTGAYRCIAPTSVWFTKQYPLALWAEVIQQLPADETVYLVGAPSDAAICDSLIRMVPGRMVTNLAGKFSLLASAALMQGARMNYVNDSAPLHLCSSTNAPTTAVFCSTVPEFGFGPLADVSRVAQTPHPLDCRPCNLHGRAKCPLGHFLCANSIDAGDVAGRQEGI